MEKILRWLFFGVVVSLLPLGFAYFDLVMKDKPATWVAVLGNGELLVIIWALAAGAIGELFGSKDGQNALKIVSGGLTLIVLISAAHFFATITEARASNANLDDAFIVKASVELFIVSLVPSLACLALTGA
jgi:hypothetical protein